MKAIRNKALLIGAVAPLLSATVPHVALAKEAPVLQHEESLASADLVTASDIKSALSLAIGDVNCGGVYCSNGCTSPHIGARSVADFQL